MLANPLPVEYMWQQDNGPDGWRQCQTSSIAMCLKYLGVPGINDDVDYLKIVQKYGDTTLQSSHQQALKSLGVPAKFKTDGGKQDLINRIDAGFPVPIGVLHHGPVTAPSGGGHYIVLIGHTETHAICHDPLWRTGHCLWDLGRYRSAGRQVSQIQLEKPAAPLGSK